MHVESLGSEASEGPRTHGEPKGRTEVQAWEEENALPGQLPSIELSVVTVLSKC